MATSYPDMYILHIHTEFAREHFYHFILTKTNIQMIDVLMHFSMKNVVTMY